MTEKYKNYKFNENKDWRKYILSLFPTPKAEKMEKLKREWYKKNVDSEFDIKFTEENDPNKPPPKSKIDWSKKFQSLFYTIENYCKITFMTSPLFFKFMAYYVAITINIFGFIRQYKKQKTFTSNVLKNSFIQNLIYQGILYNYPAYRNILFFIPLLLHYWIGVCEFLKF